MSDFTNLIVLGLSVVTIVGLFLMGINAVRLLKGFRNGVLARGWKFIAIAAFFLIYGIVALDLSISTWLPSGIFSEFLGYSGAACQALGGLAFAYGCKAQYDAWNPRGMKTARSQVTENVRTS